MNEYWDYVIEPSYKWYDLRLGEVFRYRDLMLLFVKRSFAAQYKQTILGPLWFIINPLITSFISTLIFGNIAGIDSDKVPYFLFYICGYTLWNYFSTCVSENSVTFRNNVGIMGKVYFPRLVMPISTVIFSAINMIMVFAMTIITIIAYNINGFTIIPIWKMLWILPILIMQTAVLGLGVGIIISSLTTKYWDLAILVSFGLQLWMYITPIVYPLSRVEGKLRLILLLNPMTTIIQNFRYVLLGSGSFELEAWEMSLVMTIIIFVLGVIIFNKVERTFMDTV